MSSTVRSYGLIAYGVNQAKDLEVGTQLCTKDGRRCGNAHIMEVKRSEEPMSFLVRTDAGSEMVCTVNEIHEIWTIGPYFIKPVQAGSGGAPMTGLCWRLTPLQAMVAAHYDHGEFSYIKTQDDAQNVGDGLFTFCVNEAGDAGDKSELINMLNRAIEQLRSLVGELEAVDGRTGEGVAA